MKRRAFLGGLAATLISPVRAYADSGMKAPTSDELARYAWLDSETPIRKLETSIASPSGFKRIDHDPASFGAWLRGFPLREKGTPVKAFSGRVLHEGADARVAAVAEIDCGTTDLQQCADSAIRLHAEWLWSRGEKSAIGYHFLSGDFATWPRYAAGERPKVDGNKVVWRSTAKPSESRATFRSYLDMVFEFANTISLSKECSSVDKSDLAVGDVFIQPGSPGHAVVVLDLATSSKGARAALLGQGFMPAQDFHVLASGEAGLSPWFSLEGDTVDTPFWDPFPWSALKRFPKHAK